MDRVLGLVAAAALAGCRSGAAPLEPDANSGPPAVRAAEAEPAAVAPGAVEPSGDPSGQPSRFSKGERAPAGLSPAELLEYAQAQGDPYGGRFGLGHAYAGDAALEARSGGSLVASLHTTMGTIDCELFEAATPLTVANFVGLARGVRPWYDKGSNRWRSDRYYDGVIFHRVIKGFMIQGGDHTGSGSGEVGYVIADEPLPHLRHDGPGTLSMANRGSNTGSSQFFIAVAATPHLDGKHTVFGRCDPKVPFTIAAVKVDAKRGNRPFVAVTIDRITFRRR